MALTANFQTKQNLNASLPQLKPSLGDNIDLSKYATKEYVEEVIEKISYYLYYNSLSSAINDINTNSKDNIVEEENAKIKVFSTIDDRKIIVLLDNIEENNSIFVQSNIDLLLNGKTITFTNPSISLAFYGIKKPISCKIIGDNNSYITKTLQEKANRTITLITNTAENNLVIDGGNYNLNGSSSVTTPLISNVGTIKLLNITGTFNSDSSNIVYCLNNHGTMNIENSNFYVSNETNKAYGINNQKDLFINNCSITANTNSDNTKMNSDGIHNLGYLFIKNSKVLADACGDNADEEYATGIFNTSIGTAIIKNTNVFGTLSGLQNHGKVYVQNGIFTGYSHGGFYLAHGATGEAFIKDAVIRCGYYEGAHTDIFNGSTTAPYGSMYVGGGDLENNSNITAYFDNCTFGDEGINEYDIVLRGSNGEKNHIINLSNCTLTTGRVRIDNNTMKLNLGKNNINIDNLTNAFGLYYTNDIYRKYGRQEDFNTNDFNIIIDQINNINNISIAEEGAF